MKTAKTKSSKVVLNKKATKTPRRELKFNYSSGENFESVRFQATRYKPPKKERGGHPKTFCSMETFKKILKYFLRFMLHALLHVFFQALLGVIM